MIYMIEREPLPLYALNWKTDSRVRFYMDDKHPVGASQHQTIVIVDDAVAFSGGLDLSKWRWPGHWCRESPSRYIAKDIFVSHIAGRFA